MPTILSGRKSHDCLGGEMTERIKVNDLTKRAGALPISGLPSRGNMF